MKFGKLVPRKATRKKAVSLTLALCMMAGPGLYIPGCGSNGFLGLEDYQRDLLFGVGAVAMALFIGLDGNDGVDGTNGNGLADPAEDVNCDGAFNALDCQGPAGTEGADGQPGVDGEDGTDGLNCWDLNANGIGEPGEDINSDGVFDVLDCRGMPGLLLFDVFVDDFFTTDTGSYGSLLIDSDGISVVGIEEPALGACSAEGNTANVTAYRFAVPPRYNPGNPVSMRLFIWRTGPTDGTCFTFRLDAYRARHGTGIASYGGPRFVALNDPANPDPLGMLLVVNLPLNNTSGDPADGLGFPNDLAADDLVAFELNEVQGDGGCYTVLGVEFSEWEPTDNVSVSNAAAAQTLGGLPCAFGDCAGDGTDSDGDGIPDGCDDCVNSDIRGTIMIGGCDTGMPSMVGPDGCTANDVLLNAVIDCAERNLGQSEGKFQNCVTQEAVPALINAGLILSNDKGAVARCTGQLRMCDVLPDVDCQ